MEFILNYMVKYKRKPERVFEALSSPTRYKMVERLSKEGLISISELAKPLNISLPAALKQVRILEKEGLVICRKEGRRQLCTIDRKAFRQIADWFLAHEIFWTNSFIRLEKMLKKNNT